MSADLTDSKEQCRIDNPMSNGTIRYRIVQKQGFCLCLPQALLKGI
ncbi:hypothetical protein G744_05057 [Escherichia coli HVH 82 (4-2209276)]|nr:hypothetical protein G744_05057 [Escherichia coli HVH 82 (4-2209276)]